MQKVNLCARKLIAKTLAYGGILASLSLPLNGAFANTPQIVLNTESITLSGLSAGGYMATQFHFSYPDIVSGVGIIAAGPYGCARNSIMTALSECIDKAPVTYPAIVTDMSALLQKANNAFANDKVWLLHGTLDTRIHTNAAAALHAQYQQLVQANNLQYIDDKPFAHVFPTLENGSACNESSSPFIGACDFDAAGALLNFLLPDLKPKVAAKESLNKGQLIDVDQADLLADIDLSDTGMHKKGFIYLPNSCRDGSECAVHVSFHGCNQSVDNVGNEYASNTGLNEWAANNRMVVLYPQIAKSSLMPMNPQACWDWWGYTGDNYLTKDGKQIAGVHQIVLSLASYLNKSL